MLHAPFRTTASLSRRAALGGVGATAATFSLGHLDPATAQEATPSALARHSIVGAWMIMNPGNPPNASPAIFAADGTFSAAGAPSAIDPQRGVVLGSPVIGVWEPTGERSCGSQMGTSSVTRRLLPLYRRRASRQPRR